MQFSKFYNRKEGHRRNEIIRNQVLIQEIHSSDRVPLITHLTVIEVVQTLPHVPDLERALLLNPGRDSCITNLS